MKLATDFRHPPSPTRGFNHRLPFCAQRFHCCKAPIALDCVRQSARLEHATELLERSHRIANVDNGVARGYTIEGRVRQREVLSREQMRRDAVCETSRLGSRPRAVDEFGIDIERVHVARWSHAVGKLNGGMTRPASEISDHLPRADIGGRIEGVGGRCPLIHSFVPCEPLRTDVEPVLQKYFLLRRGHAFPQKDVAVTSRVAMEAW